MRRQGYILAVIALIAAGFGAYLVAAGALPDQYNLKVGETVPGITVPEGFELRVFMTDLAGPRMIIAHPAENVLFVSERGAGQVLAVQDRDEDGIADAPVVVVDGLSVPSGLAYHDGWLYVAEASRVMRYELTETWQAAREETILDGLPAGRHPNEVDSNLHALLIHDGELYVSIGAPCAACEPDNSRRASILVLNLDGSNERTFARGVYRALGLATNPLTGALWATVQGRPQLPDDVPEAIYELQNGDDLGWPRCHAGDIPDPDMGGSEACAAGVLQPLVTFAPQGNATGLAFYQGDTFPASYTNDLFVALYGGVTSAGEQSIFGVMHLPVNANGELETDQVELFTEGFRQSEEPGDHLGRPFDLTVAPDGLLYITDDAAGAIYQLRYVG